MGSVVVGGQKPTQELVSADPNTFQSTDSSQSGASQNSVRLHPKSPLGTLKEAYEHARLHDTKLYASLHLENNATDGKGADQKPRSLAESQANQIFLMLARDLSRKKRLEAEMRNETDIFDDRQARGLPCHALDVPGDWIAVARNYTFDMKTEILKTDLKYYHNETERWSRVQVKIEPHKIYDHDALGKFRIRES